MHTPQTAARPRDLAFALALYLATSLAFFASTLPQMARAFPGGPVAAVDGWQHVWHLWWAGGALAVGGDPFQTPLLYHPDGVNLAIHPLNLATGLLVAPVTALLGPVPAFNFALILAFTLCGLGAYLFALRAGAGRGPALVAGLLFTFSPFHATKAFDGQLELVSLQWVVFYAWLLLGIAKRRQVSAAAPAGVAVGQRSATTIAAVVFAGLALAVVGYTSLYYLVYTALFSLLFAALWLPWRAGRPGVLAYLGRLAAVALIAAVALAPLLLRIGAALAQVTGAAPGEPVGPGPARELLVGRSANLLDFLLPSYLHPLWGDAVAQLGPLLHPGVSAWNHALGYTAVVLAGVACLRRWAASWRWLVIAAAGLVLALGPELVVGTARTGVPLPYRLLLLVPGMEIAQRPGHLVVLTSLALVPLAGIGLTVLHQRFGRPALLVAVALAMIELAPPLWPTQPFAVDPAYAQLAGRPGALLVLPVEIDSSDVLRDQIVHGRPLIGGYLARTPPYPFAELTPGVRQLWRLQPDTAALADPAGGTPADVLAAYNVRDVVVRWERIPEERRDTARQALAQTLPGVAPSYDDGRIAVYPVADTPSGPLAFFSKGWYPEERDGGRRWRWMGEQAELVLINPSAAPAPITLHLRGESYARERSVELLLNGAPAGAWQVAPQPAATETSLRLLLPSGESRLTLAAPADPDPGGRGPISIVVSEVEVGE